MSDPNATASMDGNTLCGSCAFVDDIHNEMCTGPGQLRPHWEYFGRSLDAMGKDELVRRYREARRLIRDNDVTYNIYNDPQGIGRPWDLDMIPLLIGSEEWSVIEAGLIQRAELLNLVLADLYGPRRLIEKGILPPELVYSFPSYLRPCAGIENSDGRYLHLYAADLARGPDGRFQVLADRTQAPSGAGYALENRIVMSRVMPSLFRDSHVHRLAPFFRAMRSSLNSLAAYPDAEPRIVLLSPGVGNESYFEHAYLANYLGYTLVQGDDLTVRDGRVWLKTLDKLQQVDVILRRVDDEYCDPLELREDSYLGVPGLLQVVRDGNVAIANPLGSGVLQNPGLMAFMPQLAQYFLGEDLRIPNAGTWWCGNAEHRRYVLANLDKLVIKPFVPVNKQRTVFASKLADTERKALIRQIETRPHMFVAQSQVILSAAPVLARNAELDSRHVVVRSYLVSRDQSYVVMPGALTRVSDKRENFMVSSQQGGASKDTWVLASEPEKQDTLIVSSPHVMHKRPLGGDVPSRVADNLFWLGRYAERAEGLVRLLRVVQLYLADSSQVLASGRQSNFVLNQLLRVVTHTTKLYPGFVGEDAELRLASPEEELLSVIVDHNRQGSLSQTLIALLVAARSVRDRLSTDTLRVINDIDMELSGLQQGNLQHLNDADDELDNLITALMSLSGLINENMTHEQGWRFLEIGRRIERAVHTTTLIRSALVYPAQPDDESVLLESMLSILDSLMTYKRNFLLGFEIPEFLDVVLLNETNPRSVGYQLARIQTHAGYLPVDRSRQQLSAEERLVLELLTQLRLADASDLAEIGTDASIRVKMDRVMDHIQQQLLELSNVMTTTYFRKDEQIQQLVPTRPGGME